VRVSSRRETPAIPVDYPGPPSFLLTLQSWEADKPGSGCIQFSYFLTLFQGIYVRALLQDLFCMSDSISTSGSKLVRAMYIQTRVVLRSSWRYLVLYTLIWMQLKLCAVN